MLQQTQVNRVRDEYYPQFLAKFPSLKQLASAHQDEVLAAWSGLGYYSRARNLHKTAQKVQNTLPTSKEELMKLPGIGEYTASAICSFGLNQTLAVVDTNIARVLKRHFALFKVAPKTIWTQAQEFVNKTEARSHNLALMDLGSLICLPKNPKCTLCPLQKSCLGKNEPELYTQTKKTLYEKMELFLGVCIQENKIALLTSKEKMYKDMLVLPNIEPIEEDFIASFKHTYTKYKITVKLYKFKTIDNNYRWIALNELHTAPISSLTKKAKMFFQ